MPAWWLVPPTSIAALTIPHISTIQRELHLFQRAGGTQHIGQTWAVGINNEGQIVGGYNVDPDSNTDQGYLYDQVHGTFTTIDDPNGIVGTEVQGINDLGQIVGYYYGADGLSHGFVDNGGIFTTFDNPLGVNGTFVTGINNSDQVVGYYTGADGFNHAFETSFNASSATENTPLVLTKLHVSDPGAGNNPIEVTLAVAHGTLALNDTTGLTASFDAGHDTLTVTGTVAAIDAALLKGVVYTPGNGFIGDDTLTVTANDQGHNSSGVPLSTTQTVDIPVIQQANEFITGGGGNDIITGGGGNDTLTGGAGSEHSFSIRISARISSPISPPAGIRSRSITLFSRTLQHC